MDINESNSLLNNSKQNIKSKNKGNSILIPLNDKEIKQIYNVSTKYDLHNNYSSSSSVDNKKNCLTNKKNLIRKSIINNIQKENSEDNNSNIDINLNIDQLTSQKKEKEKDKDKENKEQENNSKKSIYKILVAVRCRPLSQKEKEISPKETIHIIDKKIIKLKDPNGFLNPNNIRAKEQTLEFDHAFDKEDSQETIFNNTTKPLIDGVVNGFNATVFAYGATGAGKTYTMLGNDDNPGIMSLTFGELFKKIKNYTNRDYLIKLWYLEIYNENIKDLLINNSPNLELREDPNRGLIVNGITEIITNSSEHILSILKKGNKNRTTEATNANQTSSRSHAILQIMVSYKEKTNTNNKIKYGKLSLIDLAGSERASVTKNKGMRLIEGANINKSLLTLGNCINALCESNIKGTKPHVPYRDSKLTRLLKDSLGGNSRTVMIANISPFIYNFDDTYNTLNYADRAKHIKTRVKANVINNKNIVNNYLNVIKHLQEKVSLLQNQLNINKMDKKDILNINNVEQKIKENEKNNEEENNKINLISDKKKGTSKSLEKNEQRKIIHENIINYVSNFNIEGDKILDKKNFEDIIEENEKKINGIIEEYVQLSKAEVQIKQKVMGIKYDIINLNNKILKNEVFFPFSLSSSFSKGISEKTKLKSLKRILDKNTSLLSDISQKNEKFLKKYTENNAEESNIEMNEFQKNYMLLINKSSGIEKENIQIKYDNAIIKINLDKKDNYIKALKKQIDLRDNILQNKLLEMNKETEGMEENIDIRSLMNPRQKFEYLTLEQLEYKYLLLNNKNSNNYTLNKNSSFSSMHNYTSGYQKNKYSFRPRNASFINKRETITKQKFNFDDSIIYTDNFLYNDSESNINNSCLNIGFHSLHSKRDKNSYKDTKLILNISNKKDKNYNQKKKEENKSDNKNQFNICPITFKNNEINNNDINNQEGLLNFNQNFINSNEENINKEDIQIDINCDENLNDITLYSMLNDIEEMNCDVMSKLNIIENNKINFNNNTQKKLNNININANTSKKKNKTSKKKDIYSNIKNENSLFINETKDNNNNNQKININKNNKNRNTHKVYYNNLNKGDIKSDKNTKDNDNKNYLITKTSNTNKKETNPKIHQIVVKRNKKKNNSISKKNSFAPSLYESNLNKNSSIKKININCQKDFICSSSSTQNIISNNNLENKKIIFVTKNRNSSMVNRNKNSLRRKSIVKDRKNIKNYNTNNYENNPTRNLNRSVVISEDQKDSLDFLINEPKKCKKNSKNIISYKNDNKLNGDYNINENNKNSKLQQFYADHLINKNSFKKKRSSAINNITNDYSNYISNNDSFEVHKSYEYPEKNIDTINKNKYFDFKMELKEKIKQYDKFNIKQLTQYDIKKKKK